MENIHVAVLNVYKETEEKEKVKIWIFSAQGPEM